MPKDKDRVVIMCQECRKGLKGEYPNYFRVSTHSALRFHT